MYDSIGESLEATNPEIYTTMLSSFSHTATDFNALPVNKSRTKIFSYLFVLPHSVDIPEESATRCFHGDERQRTVSHLVSQVFEAPLDFHHS